MIAAVCACAFFFACGEPCETTAPTGRGFAQAFDDPIPATVVSYTDTEIALESVERGELSVTLPATRLPLLAPEAGASVDVLHWSLDDAGFGALVADPADDSLLLNATTFFSNPTQVVEHESSVRCTTAGGGGGVTGAFLFPSDDGPVAVRGGRESPITRRGERFAAHVFYAFLADANPENGVGATMERRLTQ